MKTLLGLFRGNKEKAQEDKSTGKTQHHLVCKNTIYHQEKPLLTTESRKLLLYLLLVLLVDVGSMLLLLLRMRASLAASLGWREQRASSCVGESKEQDAPP